MMKSISIIKKIKRNIASGFLSNFVVLAMGIFIPRIVLTNYGSEINGFLNSISQIFICLELLEAGIGTATLQSLFNSLSNNDKKETNKILSATSIFYNRVGSIYLSSVLILSIFYPLIIESDIPYTTMGLIILMQGIPSACSYFINAKFKLLLAADGKAYVQNNINLIVKVISNLSKIILIMLGYNILIVQLVFFIINMVQIYAYKIYQELNYNWVNYNEEPNFISLKKSKNIFVHQISGLIFENTDILILTFFSGLKSVSVYSIYSMVLSIITSVINSISSGIYFYMGQTFNSDRNKYLKIHNINETLFSALSFTLFTATYILFTPFLKIYTNGIVDVQYIDPYLPMLFIVIKLLATVRDPSLNALNFAQYFKETQHHAIIEMIINIVISLVGVHYLGIYGVLFGTIAALLYRGNMMIIYANKKILNRSSKITYKRCLICFSVYFLICHISKFINIKICDYINFFVLSIPITFVLGVLYFSIMYIFNKQVFVDIKEMDLIKKILTR